MSRAPDDHRVQELRRPFGDAGRLSVTVALIDAMLDHAGREAPLECVGLLFGHSGRAKRLVELPNIAVEPTREYFAEPGALLAALVRAQQAGEELVAIYHSHPSGPDTPSQSDLGQAHYDVPQIVLVPARRTARAYRFAPDGAAFHEVELLAAGGW